jgi:ABC-2 type transport system permease protein
MLQVSGGLMRASLAVAMQYRSDFWMDAFTGVLRALAAIAPIALVFGHRSEVVGWTASEVTLVVGLFFLMQGLLAGFVEPNLGEIVEAIRSGSLDFLLLKPADAQLLASVRRLAPGRLWDIVFAAALCGWSLLAMEPPSALDVAMAGLMLVSGLAAMYGVWLLAICTSFWFVRVDNLRYLLWAATDAGRWPLAVFAPWVRFLLLTVVPVGILTTFPALALRGDWTWGTVATGCAVGLGFLVLSRAAWNRALSSYTSASS